MSMVFAMSYYDLPANRNYHSTDEDMDVTSLLMLCQEQNLSKYIKLYNFVIMISHNRVTRVYKIKTVIGVNSCKKRSIEPCVINYRAHNIMMLYCKCKHKVGLPNMVQDWVFHILVYTTKKMNTEFGLGESIVLNIKEQLNNFFHSPPLQYKSMKQKLKPVKLFTLIRKMCLSPSCWTKICREVKFMLKFKWHINCKMDGHGINWYVAQFYSSTSNWSSEGRQKLMKKLKFVGSEVIICCNKNMDSIDLMNLCKVFLDIDCKVKIKYPLYLCVFNLLHMSLNNTLYVYEVKWSATHGRIPCEYPRVLPIQNKI